MKKYCGYCGTPINDDMQNCPSCSARLTKKVEQEKTSPDSQHNKEEQPILSQQQKEEKELKRESKNATINLFCLISLICGIVAFCQFFSGNCLIIKNRGKLSSYKVLFGWYEESSGYDVTKFSEFNLGGFIAFLFPLLAGIISARNGLSKGKKTILPIILFAIALGILNAMPKIFADCLVKEMQIVFNKESFSLGSGTRTAITACIIGLTSNILYLLFNSKK